MVEVKPKRQRHGSAEGNVSSVSSSGQVSDDRKPQTDRVQEKEVSPTRLANASDESKDDNPVKGLLLPYESSDDDD